jgi:dTDP-4-dehydrorhamnose 3,5-epimerase|tara:strand:+ start:8601 stop:9155 length:555 start_codon:yes stop_codon:yes gene_type:complete
MQVKHFQIKGPMLFDIDAYKDHRGTFLEAFNESKMAPYIKENFKQDNISYSNKNVVRGLHYQEKSPQGKLMYCLKGKILDVAVDIREGSSTFGQHVSVVLDAEEGHQAFYVPPGFAHGFAVHNNSDAVILYKCTTLYEKEYDRVLSWNSAGIDLPKNFLGKEGMIMSEKDINGTPLSQTQGVKV